MSLLSTHAISCCSIRVAVTKVLFWAARWEYRLMELFMQELLSSYKRSSVWFHCFMLSCALRKAWSQFTCTEDQQTQEPSADHKHPVRLLFSDGDVIGDSELSYRESAYLTVELNTWLPYWSKVKCLRPWQNGGQNCLDRMLLTILVQRSWSSEPLIWGAGPWPHLAMT